MSKRPQPLRVTDLPDELTAAITRDAERDADAVAQLLRHLRIVQDPGEAPGGGLSAPFLLGLGMALRLFTWEASGLQVHREAGIGSAAEVLSDVVRRALVPGGDRPDTSVPSLSAKVLALAVRRFAWDGPEVLGADVLVGEADDEDLVDALAQLCWACRNTGGTSDGQSHTAA